MSKIVVPIYKEKCAICAYMNPRKETTFDCHFSKGNELCPAKLYVFSVGFSVTMFAKRYSDATIHGDVVKLQKILETVKEQPIPAQEEFWNLAIGNLVASVDIEEVELSESEVSTETQETETETETQASTVDDAKTEANEWD